MREINLYNKLFYECCEDAFFDSGLANFFVSVEPIQIAFKKEIEQKIKKEKIKLLELASGANPRRWQTIASEKTERLWDITLSDFSQSALPDLGKLRGPKYKFSKRRLSLLNPFKKLPEKVRYDVVLATYAFDSIWFDEDLHLEKVGKKWVRTSYELKVKSEKLKSKISRFGANENCIKNLELDEFDDIQIVKTLQDFEIRSFKYGKEILDRYSGRKNIRINFPGGLINKVNEAFKKIISKNGIFLIGDIAVNSREGHIRSDNKNYPNIYMDDYRTVGKVAKCKVEDYGLAKIILEKQGYKVELVNIMDFVEKAGQITPINITDHFVMSVSN